MRPECIADRELLALISARYDKEPKARDKLRHNLKNIILVPYIHSDDISALSCGQALRQRLLTYSCKSFPVSRQTYRPSCLTFEGAFYSL